MGCSMEQVANSIVVENFHNSCCFKDIKEGNSGSRCNQSNLDYQGNLSNWGNFNFRDYKISCWGYKISQSSQTIQGSKGLNNQDYREVIIDTID